MGNKNKKSRGRYAQRKYRGTLSDRQLLKKELLLPVEAAAILRVNERSIYRYLDDGTLEFVSLGKKSYVKRVKSISIRRKLETVEMT